MALPAKGDERLDPGRHAGRHIGLAEIAGVGQHRFGLAKLLRQGVCLGQHRLKLTLVVRGLRHTARDNQQAAFGDSGLGVVALLEAAS